VSACGLLHDSLCRLPKLDALEVNMEGATLPVMLMTLALYSMRTQLPQLRCLDLDLQQSWCGAARVWRELGNMTQLTGLLLHCSNKQVIAEGACLQASCCSVLAHHSIA
jgi:hypothetical protein